MKHKHSEVLHAFADGIECQFWCNGNNDWLKINCLHTLDSGLLVRINPEAQKEQETHIKNYEKVLKAYRDLVEIQDKKIIDLTMKLTYANQTIENLTVDEPPKEQEPQYLYVYRHIDTSKTKMCNTLMQDTSDWDYLGKVRMEK